MKRVFLALSALTMVACVTATAAKDTRKFKEHPQWVQNATIYELNTRQLTPQGTFKAAQGELPRLKELGVDIIWVMPIQPIGVKERKGELGSYYAIKDYTDFNPEFGTRADFQAFVDEAHKLGFKVILDWVANHTSPDHDWTTNKDWYMRDSVGNLAVRYDWTDIAELNYDNPDVRNAMLCQMKWWVDSINVDGFRCDVAFEVPTDFWEDATLELQKSKPDLFMLAEADHADNKLTENAFDMHYGWDFLHTINAVAAGKVPADSIWGYYAKHQKNYADGAITMNFTSNHDENSWNKTEFQRMGEKGAQAYAVLTYLMPGMPLIYSGQEFGNHRELRFFAKDTVERNLNAPQGQMYKELNKFRKANVALHSPQWGANLVKIENSAPAKVFSLKRTEGDNEVVGIFNFSPDVVDVELVGLNGDYKIYPTAAEVTIDGVEKLEPYGYKVYYK